MIRAPLPGASEAADADAPGRCAPDGAEPDGVPAEFHPALAAWFADASRLGPPSPSAGRGRRSCPAGTSSWPHRPGRARPSPASSWPSTPRTGPRRIRPGSTRATPARGPGVVYISPLRALAVDVEENLRAPLEGIAVEARRFGPPHRRS